MKKAFKANFDKSDSSSSEEEVVEEESSRSAGYFWQPESVDDNDRVRSSSFGQESHASSFESFNAGPNHDPTIVSAENERQILLLMLLAQVCALHDPTPRTFTVHVLELYERGILDRDSIGFLFDLGLVPHKSSPTNSYPLLESSSGEAQRAIQLRQSLDPNHLRAQEASAIRSRLERQESSQAKPTTTTRNTKTYQRANSEPVATSWDVDQHPLSLSRYFRDFHQIKLLNSGSFGSVFHSTNKMDGRDYAIKRVIFSESGYSNETVTQVVREVRCLAQCDHPNVVRYHTSWLEPSWVTGSGTAVSSADEVATKQVQRRLLTGIHKLVNNGIDDSGGSLDNDEHGGDYSSRFDSNVDSFASDWSSTRSSHADGLQLQAWNNPDKPCTPTKDQNRSSYRYQMCFFIQMQLCKQTTLADWIRDQKKAGYAGEDRYESALEILLQLAKGLEHIHAAEIVHRDMKPANCLVGEDGHFKIGDFGLSKLLFRASGGDAAAVASAGLILVPSKTSSSKDNGDWQEPLTMGVGTTSYCAPEQVSTNAYDAKADIFSLGLILLELFCSFGTEHERIHTFHDCRRGELPQKLQQMYPDVAELILWCTNPEPSLRPSARDLLHSPPLRRNSGDHRLQVQGMRGKLDEKEAQIQKQRSELEEKDRIIEELRREMAQLSRDRNTESVPQNHNGQDNPALVETGVEDSMHTLGIVESTSFSDGDY